MDQGTQHGSLAIRDVVMFTPNGRLEGDCVVDHGRIARIDATCRVQADLEVDGRGRWLWPGAFDGHVHFRQPGATHKEDWYTGCRAAVSGGVTTVFDMPNTSPPTTTIARLDAKRAAVSDESLCNFGLFFGATPHNHHDLQKARGVPGLKIFMGCSTGDLLVYREEDLDEVFAAWTGKICVHAESEVRLRRRAEQFAQRRDPAVHSEIRDPTSAAEAVELACRLALDHGRDLHILHVSCIDELDVIAEARQEARSHGLPTQITCEVCPHHLFLNTDAYQEWGTRVQMNPPLRHETHRQAMWEGLHDGAIQMIATDHAPHTTDEKDREYGRAPSGVPGVETMVPLMLDAAHRGMCSYEDVLQWVCHRPANIYSVVGRGQLREGHAADLVLIDPALTRRVRDRDQFSKCQWSPWAGRTLTGWPTMTWVNGQLVYQRRGDGRGQVVESAGAGQQVQFAD